MIKKEGFDLPKQMIIHFGGRMIKILELNKKC